MGKRKNGGWSEYHNVHCNTEGEGDADSDAGDKDDKVAVKNKDGEGGYAAEGGKAIRAITFMMIVTEKTMIMKLIITGKAGGQYSVNLYTYPTHPS